MDLTRGGPGYAYTVAIRLRVASHNLVFQSLPASECESCFCCRQGSTGHRAREANASLEDGVWLAGVLFCFCGRV